MRYAPTHRLAVGVCPCGKRVFRNRKEARKAAREVHPGESLVAYECPEAARDGVWHYGHDETWRRPPRQVESPSCPQSVRKGIAAVAAATMRAAG